MRQYRIYGIGLALGALVVGRPAGAQTPAASDLVGQWSRRESAAVRFSFRSDSTFSFSGVGTGQMSGGKPQPLAIVGHWHLTADTLVFSRLKLKVGTMTLPQTEKEARGVFSDDTIRLLTLEGPVLTMKTRDARHKYVYSRVDSLVPDPATSGAEPRDTAAPAGAVQSGALAAGDSGRAKSPAAAACTKVQAYVKQLVADSIDVLRKNGKLQPMIDSIQRAGRLELRMPPNIPDSVRSLLFTAGSSCQPIDLTTMLQLIQPVPGDTAGKPRQP